MRKKLQFHAHENPVSSVGNRKSLPRNGQILRNFEIFLPKFHFILPNFYIQPPWGMFVFQRFICRFLREN